MDEKSKKQFVANAWRKRRENIEPCVARTIRGEATTAHTSVYVVASPTPRPVRLCPGPDWAHMFAEAREKAERHAR